MFIKLRHILFLAILAAAVSVFLAPSAFAYQIQSLGNLPVQNDYVLLQSKNELSLDPGQTAVKQLSIINRLGREATFNVSVEDFGAAKSTTGKLDFYGQNSGPYSLKDYLFPEVSSFTLLPGEMMLLPVTVKIPADAAPGGLYGAVFISSKSTSTNQTGGKVQVVTRLASLFFVRVNGNVNESGQLQQFNVANFFNRQSPIKFNLAFFNNGSIYLNPHGQITINTLTGRTVSTIKILPYYVMPEATRFQVLTFNDSSLFGLYRAHLDLSPGYGSTLTQRDVYFVVLPWLKSLLILVGLIIFAWLILRLIILFKK